MKDDASQADVDLRDKTKEFELDALIGASLGDGLWARTLAARLQMAGLRVQVRSGDSLLSSLHLARHLLLFVPGPILGDIKDQGFSPWYAPAPNSTPRRERRILVPLIISEARLTIVPSGFPAYDIRRPGVLEEVYPALEKALRFPKVPQPEYPNEVLKGLGDELEAAQLSLDRFRDGADGLTEQQLRERIRHLRGDLREGGGLVPGFILSGRYRLLSRIGVGGFGTVWRAWDRTGHREVALKVLHQQHTYNPSRIKRFFRGATAMAGLNHKGIVSVYGHREIDGGYRYFVMDYIDGASLETLVLEGKLGRDAILRAILGVGEALGYSHGRGIIHRDIKPANILLDSAGAVHLTDFDLVWSADGDHSLTTGALGTFVFAAPEQLRASEGVLPARDVYSLGMSTVFALHGQPLAPAILFEREEFIDELDIGPRLKAVLKRAVSLNPQDRYGSMAMFCRSLKDGWDS